MNTVLPGQLIFFFNESLNISLKCLLAEGLKQKLKLPFAETHFWFLPIKDVDNITDFFFPNIIVV